MRLVFWAALSIIAYVYVGYPLVLRLCAFRGRPTRRDERYVPTVSLVIAAHNEERVLRDKLDNALRLDYPREALEIVVASDGSTDATNAIARAYGDRGVILHELMPRGGKTRALNLVVPRTRGEILILSDANAMYRTDAVRKLVRHFVDPDVGAVSGDVRLENAADTHARSEGLYYRYERRLQELESQLGSIVGVDGAMYALRRSLFRPPSDTVVLDDFVISMTVARLGSRVLYDSEAVATEEGTPSAAEEFQRKARIIAGGIQALGLGEGLPRWSQPALLAGYLSHKLLRWLTPCFMLLTLASSAALAGDPLYRIALGAQLAGYALAVAYAMGFRNVRWAAIPYYFCMINGAALVGLWRGSRGRQSATWTRTRRSGEGGELGAARAAARGRSAS